MKKLLIVNTFQGFGGGEIFVAETLAKLKYEKYYLINDCFLPELLPKDKTYLFNVKSLFRKFLVLKNVMSKTCPDLVLLNGGYGMYFSFFLYNVPTIVYHHITFNSYNGIKKFIYIFLYTLMQFFTQKIICVSRYACNQGLKICRNKYTYIYHGIVNLPNAQHGHNTEIMHILYVGRITKNKGLDVICEVVGKLQKNYNIILNIVGDYKTVDFDIDIYKSDNIIFHGFYNDVSKFYEESDVFISLPKYEAFGLSILDAMNHSLAVIATAVGGIPELVEDGKGGILIKHNKNMKDSVCKAILSLIQDRKLLQVYGEYNKARVKQNFDLNKTILRIENVIDTI
ncbi:glycosyl transferase family 1 [Spirochaetia bacterium]|nr:glycosyl transferase family 1 [Spirochaetia bacterium]